MFSIFTTAYNINLCSFDYKRTLSNFCKFAGKDGEVIVCVPILSGDDSYELLSDLRVKNPELFHNLKIFICNFSINDPEFDGKTKNFALQQCSNDVCIQMDLDELFVYSQRQKWIEYINFFKYQSDFDCFMIPVLEPWGDISKIREDHGVKFKFRIHFKWINRGVVDYAKREDGTHDINLSDGTEPIDENGQLVKSHRLINPECYESLDNYLKYLKENIYTIHLGYVSFKDRIKRINNFWREHWIVESGGYVELPRSEKEMEYPTINHGLFETMEEIL